nr:DUF3088 family protein [uncultured Pseudodesulfovibrio sp.]
MEGLLGYFPQLLETLDVIKIGFERPRAAIIDFLGEDNQDCPSLVLADPAKADGLPVKRYGKYTFINDHRVIIEYLARNHGTSRPSHD